MSDQENICPLTKTLCPFEKSIHVTEVSKGKATNCMSLCKDCSGSYLSPETSKEEEPGVEIHIEFEPVGGEPKFVGVVKSAAELFEILSGHGLPVEMPVPREPCPQCGMTLDDFNRVGRFGCPKCYDHYMEEFLALAGPFQAGADKHQGKTPNKAKTSGSELLDKISVLRLRLAQAIELERYENAAALKKELDQLLELYGTQS